MKEAYVTLVATDSYAAGALVVCHRLRELGSTRDIVCLVTPNVSAQVQDILSNNCRVIVVDLLKSKDIDNLQLLGRPELDITFTKIQLWTLTDYDKLVFLDADTYPTRNIDDLFKWPSFSAAPDAGWPDCFNSGVFVTEPSEKTYSDLLDLAMKKGSFDGGDQGLLNSYFSSWSTSPSNRLPFTFNTTPTTQYGYAPAHNEYSQHISVVHFIGSNKPWRYQRFSDGKILPMGQWEGINHMVQAWWDTWDTYYGRLSPYHLLSGDFNKFDDGFQTRPIVQFDEIIDNAWKDQTVDWDDNRRHIEPMPPMPVISTREPTWLKEEIERQKQEQIKRDQELREQERQERERRENERREHERREEERQENERREREAQESQHRANQQHQHQPHHEEAYHEEAHHKEHHHEEQHHEERHCDEQHHHQEPTYTFIEWDPSYQEPPNTGMGANIPDLSHYSNAWDEPYRQAPWIPPTHQPEPEIMKKPEYSHYNTEDYAPDAYYAPIHHEFNPPPVEHHHEEHHHEEHHHEEHHYEEPHYEEPRHEEYHEPQVYYPPAFPWEEKENHFPPPSRIWLDELPQDYQPSEPQQHEHHHHEEPRNEEHHHHQEYHHEEPRHEEHHHHHEEHHYHHEEHHHNDEHHHHEEPHYHEEHHHHEEPLHHEEHHHYEEHHHHEEYHHHEEHHHYEEHHHHEEYHHHEEPYIHGEHHQEYQEPHVEVDNFEGHVEPHTVEGYSEIHETVEPIQIENHPEPEVPVFAIDEGISPSAQTKLDEFIASLASDDEDISDRDLIPIYFKPRSRLSGMFTPSPGNSRSSSRVNSRSGSRRASVSSSRRNSVIVNKPVPFEMPNVTQPHNLFATSSSAFSHKTPYTSAAVTPSLGPSSSYESYFDDEEYQDDSDSLKSDFLHDYGYSLNESLTEPSEWDPLKALNNLKQHSESMVLRQSLQEALVKTAKQQQQQEEADADVEDASSPLPPPVISTKKRFHFKSSWDDEEYDIPSALISGESSPRTPIARTMSSDLSKEIESEKERYRQQRASLMLSQPQTAIASVLEAELDLSRGTLFKRRYYDDNHEPLDKAVEDITASILPAPVAAKPEVEKVESIAQNQFVAYYGMDVIEESKKRLQALLEEPKDVTGGCSVIDIKGKLIDEKVESTKEEQKFVKESTEPTKKVAEFTKEEIKPIAEAVSSVVEVVETTKGVVEPVEEVVEPVEEVVEPVKEEAETIMMMPQPNAEAIGTVKEAEHAKEIAEPVKEVVKPTKEIAATVKENVESVKKEIEPVEEVAESAKETTRPTKEVTEPVEEVAEPVDEVTEPAKETTILAKEVVELAKEVIKPVKEIVETAKKEIDEAEPAMEVVETVELTKQETKSVKEEVKATEKVPESAEEEIETEKEVAEPVKQETSTSEPKSKLVAERVISKEELEDPMPLPIEHFDKDFVDDKSFYPHGKANEPQPFSLMFNFRAYQSNFGFNEHHKLKIYNPALLETDDQNEDVRAFNPEVAVLSEDPIRKRQRIERERIEAEERRIREAKEAEEKRIKEAKETEEKEKLEAQNRAEKRKLRELEKKESISSVISEDENSEKISVTSDAKETNAADDEKTVKDDIEESKNESGADSRKNNEENILNESEENPAKSKVEGVFSKDDKKGDLENQNIIQENLDDTTAENDI